MELPIAVSADENSTALSSCHSELLLEEVGSLDAVAMHGGVDLLLVGLPRLIIITIIIIIIIIIISIICQACSSSSLGSQSFLPVRNVGRIVGVRKQRSVPAWKQLILGVFQLMGRKSNTVRHQNIIACKQRS